MTRALKLELYCEQYTDPSFPCGNKQFSRTAPSVELCLEPECEVLNTEMPLTEVEAIELDEATVRQSEHELWFEARNTD